jgi:hypothetical protein
MTGGSAGRHTYKFCTRLIEIRNNGCGETRWIPESGKGYIKVCGAVFRIALANISYALSDGWTASKNTYLSALSHVNELSKPQRTPVSTYPVPQHPRTEFSKPDIVARRDMQSGSHKLWFLSANQLTFYIYIYRVPLFIT